MSTQNTQTDTPETDAATAGSKWAVDADFARKLERERDEAVRDLERNFMPGAYARLKYLQNLEHELAEKDKQLAATNMYLEEARSALSGRTVSCSNCNETARQLEAMREAVKELRESLEVGKDSVGAWDWCNSALTKLQPLLKT